MQILGWMPGSSIVLVKTERWQWGSDAGDIQHVLAIEASTGRVYEPNLDDILVAHSGKQCWFRVEDVGFANRTSPEISRARQTCKRRSMWMKRLPTCLR